ncbi:Tryptophan--tRNA ligase, mitochondrial [Pestalotiopsis sp. IQ-011]
MAHFRWSIVAQNMVQNLPWFVAPALTFVVYVAQAKGQGQPSINTTQAFTALSIITLLTAPAAQLLSAVVSTAASVGCFDRIQLFLLAAPRNDQRSATTFSRTPTSVAEPANIQDGNVEMSMLVQDSCKNGSDPIVAIAATRLSVRPGPNLILADVNFIIPAKSVTMIIGPVASGKTTLLRTILGEINPEHGGSTSIASRRIAYAAQDPWLPNASIRNVITGPTNMKDKFDPSWYSKTLHASRYLRYADKILLLTNGRIEDGGAYGTTGSRGLEDVLHLAHDSDMQPQSVAEAPTAKETAALVAKANQRDDLARASGDMKLYGYYFKSVGMFPTWLELVLDLIVGAEAVLVVGLAVWLRGSTSVGLLGVSLNNVLSFSASLSSLVSGWTMLETSLGSIVRLRDLEATVQPEDDIQQTRQLPSNWPESGRIEFRNVTASYGHGLPGIQEIDLRIEPGQKIGICGRTGSGKSSLVSTLVQLLKVDIDSVLIDDIDLATVSGDTLRERLFVVPQESLTLSSTLRRNLDPQNTATDAALTTALIRVGLHDLLVASRGLDAHVTATTLSAGQQQLLALARPLLKKGMGMNGKDRGVLLLDEATGYVDQETEAVLQRVVREEFAGFTEIAVAHRLRTISDSDVVIVMDAGRVVEAGPPAELIEKGQWFAQLVRADHGAEMPTI